MTLSYGAVMVSTGQEKCCVRVEGAMYHVKIRSKIENDNVIAVDFGARASKAIKRAA